MVHAFAGSLTKRETDLLANDTWSISAIVLWEIGKLIELGRLELDLAGDPADQIIVATSVVHKLPLVTRDRNLRRSKQVPLATTR